MRVGAIFLVANSGYTCWYFAFRNVESCWGEKEIENSE